MNLKRKLVKHMACPECGSKNNLATYNDGYEKCFGMGCGYYGYANARPKKDKPVYIPQEKKEELLFVKEDFIELNYKPLLKRGLSEESCRFFEYGTSTLHGKSCQVANYRNAEGVLLCQKVRMKDKKFSLLGDGKHKELYGRHLWSNAPKWNIFITEGEIDAITVHQVFNGSVKYNQAVVSIPKGCREARETIAKNLEWLCSFEKVVFCFDMDDAGREASNECAALIPNGKAHIVELPSPYKDANEMLIADKGAELRNALYSPKKFAPDGVCLLEDLIDEAFVDTEAGVPYPWDSMNEKMLGIRTHEIILVGAGTGIGKTELFSEMIFHLLKHTTAKVGLFSFEMQPSTLALILAAKQTGKPYHLPNNKEDKEAGKRVILENMPRDRLHVYRHMGMCEWDKVKTIIRHWHHNDGVQYVIIDNLTQLATGREEKENTLLERIMGEAASLVQELDIALIFASHLTAPETGKTHEEGGDVVERHFKGSRMVTSTAHVTLALMRNKVAEDPSERSKLRIKVLKNRNVGSSCGEVFHLEYNPDNFRIEEKRKDVRHLFTAEEAPKAKQESTAFEDESDPFDNF
jgi:twinkle protein